MDTGDQEGIPRYFDDAIQMRLALLLRAVGDEPRTSTAAR
jgi:hypothetical protein